MAVTQNTYTGNGSNQNFVFTFGYLDPTHVKATINGTPTTAFTFFNASTLRFNTAPANGSAIRIYRETPSDNLLADYTPGSALREVDLELNLQQVLNVSQETQTFAENQSTTGLQAQIDTANTNASNAVVTANAAAATANGLSASISTANTNASNAVTTANNAATTAGNAVTTANNAQTTANAALARSGGIMTGAITFISGQSGLGRTNLLINPNFVINERGYVSGTATSGAFQYTVDRWRVVTSGQNISWSTSNGIYTVTAPAGGVEQIIEGASVLFGDYTLNWNGTATATVNGSAITKGSSFALIGGTNVTVRFSGGTVSVPQLERGLTPSLFEGRHVADELALCQRYFARMRISLQALATGASQDFSTTITFPRQMRTTPAPSLSGGSLVNLTLDDFPQISASTARYRILSAAAGNTAGIDRQLDLNAEL